MKNEGFLMKNQWFSFKINKQGSISCISESTTWCVSNEVLLESATLDSGETDNFVTESETGDGDNLVLDGTDSSSTDAGDNLIMESTDGRHKLVPEDFATGEENHIVLETAADLSTIGHYHLPVGTHHTDDDGHTAAEHREIDLWNYKLQLLITQENTNAGSD